MQMQEKVISRFILLLSDFWILLIRFPTIDLPLVLLTSDIVIGQIYKCKEPPVHSVAEVAQNVINSTLVSHKGPFWWINRSAMNVPHLITLRGGWYSSMGEWFNIKSFYVNEKDEKCPAQVGKWTRTWINTKSYVEMGSELMG